MNTTQKDMGKQIRIARAMADLSQEDLGDILNYDRQVIMRMENGKRKIDANELIKIAEATKKPLSFFYEEEKPEPKPDNRYIDLTGFEDEDVELLKQMADCIKDKYNRKKGASEEISRTG